LRDKLYGFFGTQKAERVNQNPKDVFGEAIFQKSLWLELVKIVLGMI
jgi:hypothetical protein